LSASKAASYLLPVVRRIRCTSALESIQVDFPACPLPAAIRVHRAQGALCAVTPSRAATGFPGHCLTNGCGRPIVVESADCSRNFSDRARYDPCQKRRFTASAAVRTACGSLCPCFRRLCRRDIHRRALRCFGAFDQSGHPCRHHTQVGERCASKAVVRTRAGVGNDCSPCEAHAAG